jgi:hypothetical protein
MQKSCQGNRRRKVTPSQDFSGSILSLAAIPDLGVLESGLLVYTHPYVGSHHGNFGLIVSNPAVA